jgi:ATP-binding protein involved in chromosome partitioning
MKGYHDIVGDGGSDVAGQVAAQRSRIAQSLADVRHRVAIGSGKGGVGKSTLTLRIAASLREAGREVAVLDADLNGPTQARLAGLREAALVPGKRGLVPPRTPSGIGVVSMGSVVPESRDVDFETVVRGDSHVWRAAREFAALGELLEKVEWGRLDFLLIDLPPGAERTLQYAEFLGAETAFMLVTVPSEVARGVVARSAAALRKTPNRVLGYVENMKGYYCEGCATVRPLFPEEAPGVDLGVPCLGSVPFDPELCAAGDRGEVPPVQPERPALEAIRGIAETVAHRMGSQP